MHRKLLLLAATSVLALTSCNKFKEVSYDEFKKECEKIYNSSRAKILDAHYTGNANIKDESYNVDFYLHDAVNTLEHQTTLTPIDREIILVVHVNDMSTYGMRNQVGIKYFKGDNWQVKREEGNYNNELTDSTYYSSYLSIEFDKNGNVIHYIGDISISIDYSFEIGTADIHVSYDY